MKTLHITIMDDDPFVAEQLRSSLAQHLPLVEFDIIGEPVVPAGRDVYIINRDFDGRAFGGELYDRVRTEAPEALLLSYSAEFDRGFLHRISRSGALVLNSLGKAGRLDRKAAGSAGNGKGPREWYTGAWPQVAAGHSAEVGTLASLPA